MGGITVAMAVAILLVTLTPVRFPGPAGSDKLYHFAGFGALVLPAALVRPRWLWVVVPLAIGLGGAIELVQPHVGRMRELADWFADIGGVAVGAVWGRILARLAQI